LSLLSENLSEQLHSSSESHEQKDMPECANEAEIMEPKPEIVDLHN
jgi:hypothetical protein